MSELSTAVVTVVSGRHEHLRAQRRALAASTVEVRHVVVAIDDPAIADVVVETPRLATDTVVVSGSAAGLPIAAARNRGAAVALSLGAHELIFLDVDCIPAQNLIEVYRAALKRGPDSVLCGPVTYLPPAPPNGWTAADLATVRAPHAARPDPTPGTTTALAPALFWSLSFAVRAELWRELGGFHEGYVGYGAEDTDFAVGAAARGIELGMVGGADAFHQHHPVERPPRRHLDDILRNSGVFLRRHGSLPMQGWLAEFVAEGLVELGEDGPRRRDAPVVATIPAGHPYLDAALPTTIRRFAPDRVAGWEPDPLFDRGYLREHAAEIDVLHVHFGYDQLTPAQLDDWLAEVRDLGLALVLTVHDQRNPPHRSRRRHDDLRTALVKAADVVLTLTPGAAAECLEQFGRGPEVTPHPRAWDDASGGEALGDLVRARHDVLYRRLAGR